MSPARPVAAVDVHSAVDAPHAPLLDSGPAAFWIPLPAMAQFTNPGGPTTGGNVPRTQLAPIGNSGLAGSSQLSDPYALQTPRTPTFPSTGLGSPQARTGFPPGNPSLPASGFAPGAALPPPGTTFPQAGGLSGIGSNVSNFFGRILSRPASTPLSQGFGTPQSSFSAPSTFAAPSSPYLAPGASQVGPQAGLGAPLLGPESVYQTQQPAYPSSIYPSGTPNTLFPNGVFEGGSPYFPSTGITATAFRFYQGPRLQHSYVHAGDRPSDVSTNATDASLVFAVPRFLYSNQPLYLIPSFSLHLWDGPAGANGADLPSSAYAAFLDVGWESDPNRILGTEFGIRVGAFTDFDTFNSNSIRVLGKGLVHFRLSPYSTVRGGLYYLDRNDIKLLPAGGVLWRPNPYTRVDLFFPQPKFSRYFRTIGTQDVWWYLAGDYGGGSWTIQRTDGTEDSVDMNELRATLGLEFGLSDQIRAGRRTGFVEVGYAFRRELIYRFNPQDNFGTADAILFSAGIGY